MGRLIDQVERLGVKLMQASAREWKRWQMRNSRRSSDQRMELEGR